MRRDRLTLTRRTLHLLTLGVLLSVGLRGAADGPSGRQARLLGRWRLTTVAGADPSTVQIKSYSAIFDKGGAWEYAATMSGRFEGMQLKGQGTWSLQDNALSWTAGSNSGTSKIIFAGSDKLVLDPDPVIKTPGGKQSVRTEYVRAVDGK